jgi:hypothetical protein
LRATVYAAITAACPVMMVVMVVATVSIAMSKHGKEKLTESKKAAKHN